MADQATSPLSPAWQRTGEEALEENTEFENAPTQGAPGG